MSVKRSSAGRGSATLGGGEVGGKVNRQELYDELVRRADSVFTPVDIALATGAGEPQVARALMGLAGEGVLEKVEPGKYRAIGVAEISGPDFQRIFARASKIDGSRIRDIQEIDRLKRNNDIMRARLLKAQAERDHYLAALTARGIDAGPVPESASVEHAEAKASPVPVAVAPEAEGGGSGEASASWPGPTS